MFTNSTPKKREVSKTSLFSHVMSTVYEYAPTVSRYGLTAGVLGMSMYNMYSLACPQQQQHTYGMWKTTPSDNGVCNVNFLVNSVLFNAGVVYGTFLVNNEINQFNLPQIQWNKVIKNIDFERIK